MKMKKLAAALAGALILGVMECPLQHVAAAQARVEETERLLDEALAGMESGGYARGEALVTMEAGGSAALANAGTYRYDPDIRVEEVCAFGPDGGDGRERYVARLSSDRYTAEQLMEIALRQYYVDGVSANGYWELSAADPYERSQWHLDGYGAESSGVNFSRMSVQDKETPVIAIIDTGVDYTHPDLAGCMWDNRYPGTLKGSCGYDFANGDDDPMDVNGHGTHIAGIAAAARNGVGVSGISDAKIMALKVVKDGKSEISESCIVRAFEYVNDALNAGVNIKAVNCSWGGNYDTGGVLSKMINAIGKKGALSVFAAGNDGIDRDGVRTPPPTPYDLDSPYVVIVGASNERDEAAAYSDYGAVSVDLFAPGSNILSTFTEYKYLPGIYGKAEREELTGYYNTFSNSSDNILPDGQSWEDVYTAEDLGLPTCYSVRVQHVQNAASGYIRLVVRRNGLHVEGGETAGSVYVDVTDLGLDEDSTYYVSFLDGADTGSEIAWAATNMASSADDCRFVEAGGRTYMRIVGLEVAPQSIGKDMIWYLDDIAISKADPDPSSFGKYDILEGTSMAAPMASAAAAVLAAANPSLSAKQVRGLLMKSVRHVDALSDKCKAGGILDASKFCTLAAKVRLDRSKATLRAGEKLELLAKVSPSDATDSGVTWKSGNKKYATVSSDGVVKAKKAGIGHTVKITATAADGSRKKAVCTVKIVK